MPSKTRRILLTFTIILGALGLMGIQLSRFAVDTSLRHWHDNADGMQQALLEQQRTGKPIAVFFHTDWCANCEKLRETVLASTQFSQYAQHIIPVKINPEDGPREQALARQYNVMGYPTFLMLSHSPARVTRVQNTNVNADQFIKECRQSVELKG